MRIRRNASKLLGSAIVYSSPPSPSLTHSLLPPFSSVASAVPATEVLCELNQSPWDLVLPELDLTMTNFKEVEIESTNLKEEAAEEEGQSVIPTKGRGISGKVIKKESKPIRRCKSISEKKATKENNEINKKARGRPRKEGNNIKTSKLICKKNDGKRWSCKRQASLPHSLCEYHLSQLRAYTNTTTTTTNENTKQLEAGPSSTRTHSKQQYNNNSSSDFFYYYNGFGPWRGKRRGRDTNRDGDGATNDVQVKSEDIVMDNKESVADNCDDRQSPVAGEDEEDDDDEDEEQEEKEKEKDNKIGTERDYGNYKDVEKKNKKTFKKKRGRKPIKARSLKSLL